VQRSREKRLMSRELIGRKTMGSGRGNRVFWAPSPIIRWVYFVVSFHCLAGVFVSVGLVLLWLGLLSIGLPGVWFAGFA
jgi:hypothetical protein